MESLACPIASPFVIQLVFGIDTAPSSALWDEGPASRDLCFLPTKFLFIGNEGVNAGIASTCWPHFMREIAQGSCRRGSGRDHRQDNVYIFMIPEAEVFPNKPMADFGVDSLTGVGLRNMLATKADAEDLSLISCKVLDSYS